MTRTYQVKMTAGPYAWTVTDDDPPGFGLVDPLTIGWSLPDTEHRPAQPDPMVASFGVIAPSSADMDLVLGDPVTIAVTFGPAAKAAPDVTFLGRVAQGEATAHDRGMLYRFTCADASTDLAGYDLGATPYAAESVTSRMTSMLARAGVPDADVIRGPMVAGLDPNLYVDVIEQPSAANLLTSIIELFDQVAVPGVGQLVSYNYRGIIAPFPGPSSKGLPFRWSLDGVPEVFIPTALTMLPAVFGHWFPDPGGWGLKMDPDDRAAGVIDSCVVEFDSGWAAIAPAVVNRAAVTWLTAAGWDPTIDANARVPQITVNNENPPPAGQTPVTTTRDTQTIGATPATTTAAQTNATRLGGMMVPVPQNPGGWGPDTFRWLLHQDPIGMASFPVVFPRHDATDQPTPRELRTAAYVRPIVVVGIPGKWNAADATRDWVAGQLTSIQLTIENGRPVIDFQLVPTIPEPGNPDTGTYSWNTQSGTWNAKTGVWDDLQPGRVAFRWSDTALAGKTWNQLHPQPWDLYRLARGS